MTEIPRVLFVLAASTAVLLAGCARSSPEPAPNENRADRGDAAPKTPASDRSEPPNRPARPAVPQTADAAVLAVARGIAENRPAAVWEFLPAGYQRGVNDLVHEFAETMDPELWDRTFVFLRRVASLCRDRRDAILDSPALHHAHDVEVAMVAAHWDQTVAFETLANSDLADLDKLRQIDAGRFLEQTGGNLMQQLAALSTFVSGEQLKGDSVPWDRLAGLKATLVSSGSKVAVVRLQFADSDVEPREVEFVRVEGKWIPRALAEGWQLALAALRGDLRARLAPDVLAANKAAVLAFLDRVEPLVARLEQAQTAAEFQTELRETKLVETVVAMLPPAEGSSTQRRDGKPVRPSVGQNGQNQSVTVVVRNCSDRAVASRLADRLFYLDEAVDVAPPVIERGTARIVVSPVDDLAAFARRIEFAEVLEIDADARTIAIRANNQ